MAECRLAQPAASSQETRRPVSKRRAALRAQAQEVAQLAIQARDAAAAARRKQEAAAAQAEAAAAVQRKVADELAAVEARSADPASEAALAAAAMLDASPTGAPLRPARTRGPLALGAARLVADRRGLIPVVEHGSARVLARAAPARARPASQRAAGAVPAPALVSTASSACACPKPWCAVGTRDWVQSRLTQAPTADTPSCSTARRAAAPDRGQRPRSSPCRPTPLACRRRAQRHPAAPACRRCQKGMSHPTTPRYMTDTSRCT